MYALKDEAGGGGRRVGRLHRWTAAVQAGIAVPFLVVAVVLLSDFRASARADLGFDQAGLFALPLDLGSLNPAAGDRAALLRRVQNNVAGSSDVVAVAVANGLPLDSQGRVIRVAREGAPSQVRSHTTRISPTYLKTMGIRLLRGRGISPEDREGSEAVVVISQALASRLFPGAEAVGERIRFALDGSNTPIDPRWPHQSVPASEETYTIVGMTADLVDAYLGPPNPQLFVPLAQEPAQHVYLIARSSASVQGMSTNFENAVAGLLPDPDVAGANLITAERLLRKGRSELVMGSLLAIGAGGAALLLSALGVFGVVGFMVATRTREIGIRIALGASRTRVLRGVLVDAVKLAGGGIAFGLALSYVWANEISSYSLGGLELAIYVAAAATALGVVLAAAVPAARRAAAVEPLTAMRAE